MHSILSISSFNYQRHVGCSEEPRKDPAKPTVDSSGTGSKCLELFFEALQSLHGIGAAK